LRIALRCALVGARALVVMEERERTSLFIIIVAFSAAQFPFRAANLNYIEPDGMTLLRSGATFAPPSLSLCFACRERSSFCIFLASLSCEGGAATVTFLAHKPRFASRGTRHTPIALSLWRCVCSTSRDILPRASQLAGFSVTENAKQRALRIRHRHALQRNNITFALVQNDDYIRQLERADVTRAGFIGFCKLITGRQL
jgi:hypothetical protein